MNFLASFNLRDWFSMDLNRDLFFLNALDLLCAVDRYGRFVRISQSWTELFGWSSDEVIGKSFDLFVHPDDRPLTHELFQKLLRGQAIRNFQSRALSKNGSYRWIEWNAILDPRSKLTIASGRDVTDGKRNELLLSQSEKIGCVGGWEIDLSTRELYWTEETHRLHETDPLTYRPKLEDGIRFYPPDSREEFSGAINRLIREGEPFDLELRFVTAKGRSLWIRAVGRAVIREKSVHRAYGIFLDITAQREQLEREKFFNRLSQDLTVSVDLQDRLSVIVKNALKFSTWSAIFLRNEENESLSWRIGEHREKATESLLSELESAGEVIDSYLKGAGTTKMIGPISLKKIFPTQSDLGESFVIFCPLRKKDRDLGVLVLGFEHPPSSQVELFERFAHHVSLYIENAMLLEAAEESVALRDEFLSIASHELKSPLTSVALHLQILKRSVSQEVLRLDSQAPERRRLPIGKILELIIRSERQTQKLLGLISELLDLTRIRAGKLELKCRELNLKELVDDVVEGFQAELLEKQIPCIVNIPSDLRGVWDEERIEQIIDNLISNAIKYGEGSPIEIRGRQEEGLLILEVQDRGRGLMDSEKAVIFERFARLKNAKNHRGLGLGLYIVRQVVEAHGGRIRVEAQPGEGCTFIVSLPIGVVSHNGEALAYY